MKFEIVEVHDEIGVPYKPTQNKCECCGKKITKAEWKKNNGLCDMCAEDVEKGRDKE
jgi:Zn finger protein HypA/HybF involved in hydrogenase expression